MGEDGADQGPAAAGPAVVVTVLERMLDAGVSDSRAREHLAAATVHLEGTPEAVTDPETPAPRPLRWFVAPR